MITGVSVVPESGGPPITELMEKVICPDQLPSKALVAKTAVELNPSVITRSVMAKLTLDNFFMSAPLTECM
jgi:hypothetical protein